MKNLLHLLLFLALFTSCAGDDDTGPSGSSEKSITNFVINDFKGIIDQDNKTIRLNLFSSTDLTSLQPTISISSNATVSPASGAAQDFTNPVTYTVTAEDQSTVDYTVSVLGTCVSPEDVHAFTYDGKNYEFIKLNRTWADAAACAVERGGYLAEINSQGENDALFDEVMQNGNIDINNSIGEDGGNASYIWLGGTDSVNEGTWLWDGDNDGVGIHFWEGDASGSSVSNRYTNWGIEPDDFGTQDCLGLALTQWPIQSGALGAARQWNDINMRNELFYIIEFD